MNDEDVNQKFEDLNYRLVFLEERLSLVVERNLELETFIKKIETILHREWQIPPASGPHPVLREIYYELQKVKDTDVRRRLSLVREVPATEGVGDDTSTGSQENIPAVR